MTESRIAPPVRVLVASASEASGKSAVEILSRRGFVVEISHNAEDAFEKVRSFRPGVTFYDLALPGYDGLEAVTLITRTSAGKEGYLIATSALRSDVRAAAAIGAGAWDFLAGASAGGHLLACALAIKRHVNRPKEMPRKARHACVKIIVVKCPRQNCQMPVAAFVLKEGASVSVRKDQFETPIYVAPLEGADFLDYNLISVAVCPQCYFALDSVGLSMTPGAAGSLRYVGAAEPALFAIAAEADDTLFTEDRTPAAAIVAYRLAIENQKAEVTAESPEAATRLADFLFKAAAVAHIAGDERMRDRFLGDAEETCSNALKMPLCASVYRCAYRLVAFYTFFNRDADAARIMKVFAQFEKPAAGRMKPRDSRVLETYRTAAANLVANRQFWRRASYLGR